MAHGRQGSLWPWEVRFDPDDPAHLSLTAAGEVRVRLVTEAGFAAAHLVTEAGEMHPLTRAGDGGAVQVWEGCLPSTAPILRFTFALLTDDGRPVYRVPAGIANAVERLDRWEVETATLPRVEPPAWAAGAVIYQIFPDRFRRGDPAAPAEGAVPWGTDPAWLDFQGGDLVGIAGSATYLAGLGVDAVYLNPVFLSPSTHRYDAIDYYRVDPRLGGNRALEEMVEALDGVGIRVVLDASFNHCHPRFFAFADLLEKGSRSEYADWFAIRDWPPRVLVRPDAFAGGGIGDPGTYLEYLRRFQAESGVEVVEVPGEGPPVEPTYEAWYGVPSLPRVDLTHPPARRYFLEVARYWPAEYGVAGWRMDVARYVDYGFWPDFRTAVKSVRPDAYLLAEVMGDARRWLRGDAFDATMNYTFRQLCLDFLATDRVDGRRFAEGLVRLYGGLAPETAAVCHNLIGSHDTPRFLHEAGGRRHRLFLATVLQMTLPGAPGLYYGDEVGMTGGEEPGSRGAFPWHDEAAWDRHQLETVRALGSLRRLHPALRQGSFRIVFADDDGVAFTRDSPGERVVVAVSRAETAPTLVIPVAAGEPRLVFGGSRVTGGESMTLHLDRRGVAIVSL